MSLQPLISKSANRWVLALIITATAVTGTMSYYAISNTQKETSAPVQTTPPVRKITALGRLEPETEVIKVSVPAAMNNDRIAQLLVQRGTRIKAGQVIAILDSRERLQTALKEAQEQVRVLQSKLAQVKAGAKSGEIAAQKAQIVKLQAELQGEIATQRATITRRKSEVNNAQAEYNRYQSLYREGAISASQFDQKRLALETTQAQLNEAQFNQNRTVDSLQAQISEAKQTLNKIAEVRPVDIQAAQTEIDRAIASVQRAKADLKQATILAPTAGTILEIYAKPGEVVGSNGIADLGQTDQMQVVAEIYQSDISKIRQGQKATITGESFPGELSGTVQQIGLQINKQEIESNQPGQNLDQRVIKVRIRLNPQDSKRVANLTNLQVQTTIIP
ncbi:ABC exporter membrane fusion protein [Iningainema tapete]|uniref:ABC exporter membrane fusion protein n=1 Tax=Iningainema tapete BLCC-T55 TaxID=2748662 RepID=A0A8J6XHF4_9CYAN|nr:ABC exporter membrane fusion protein [Iningainema tapete]MBD2772647.1 ABC exporter membrane fusion protein [Iningainema tapete BLCC-T55]